MGIDIITRAEWGAKPPKSVSRTLWTTNTLWVHHSDGAAPSNDQNVEEAAVRGIQAFHQGPARNWADIGYAYLIAPYSGRIYEGRGQNVWAAHCPGHNDEPSVCIMGDFHATAPPEPARHAVWALADYLGLTNLNGHREGYPTSCPGDATMRALVNAPRPSAPKPDPAPLPYSNTLRLAVNGRAWAGWGDAMGPIEWVARKGLRPDAVCAISWRGNVWRDPAEVTNVCRTLVNRFLT